MQSEHERERDQQMFQIREQEKAIKLLEQLVSMFVMPSDMAKVRCS